MRRTQKCGLLVAWIVSWVCPAVAQEFRSFDGTGNNLATHSWGAAGQALGRLTPARYADGVGAVAADLPNPRVISNVVFSQGGSVPDPDRLSEWAWVWGQFIDHDIDHTLTSSAAGMLSIPIPPDDPVFGSLPPGSAINATRAAVISGTGTGVGSPREHANNISAWLDASQVYGGRAVDGPAGVDRVQWLRDPVDPAKLRMSDGGSFGPLLPRYEAGSSPVMANTATPGMTSIVEGDLAYVAGDVRANENTSLLAVHTVFAREHNRLVDILRSTHPGLSDQETYERARKIVGAEVQAITYNEYLPSLGLQLGPYSGYDPTVNPSVLTEFSNAAFRIAHSQINAQQLRLDSSGNVIPEGNLNLADAFFQPSTLLEGGLEPLLRGLAAQVQEANDALMVDALRNQLFHMFIPGVGLVDGATDLAAIDILRSRDVGVGTLNEVRAALGLLPYDNFDQLTSDSELASRLASVYGDVDETDLFVGLLAEDPLPDGCIGPTTSALYAYQFLALRDGDRFWFQNDLAGINSDLMLVAEWDGTGMQPAVEWLQSLRLSDILQANTGVGPVADNLFFVQIVPEPTSTALLLSGLILLGCGNRRRRHGR